MSYNIRFLIDDIGDYIEDRKTSEGYDFEIIPEDSILIPQSTLDAFLDKCNNIDVEKRKLKNENENFKKELSDLLYLVKEQGSVNLKDIENCFITSIKKGAIL